MEEDAAVAWVVGAGATFHTFRIDVLPDLAAMSDKYRGSEPISDFVKASGVLITEPNATIGSEVYD